MTATGTQRSRQQQHDSEQRKALAANMRQKKRNRRIVGGAIGAVAAVVVLLVVVAASTGGSSGPTVRATPVPTAVLNDLTQVPASTLAAIGRGTSTNPPRPVSEQLRTVGGKPEVLYLGAEYCPYCAAQRWALIQALSHFGTFTGLSTTRSGANDVHPNTPSFTFHGATFTSNYLAFTARELYSNVRVGGHYSPLDKATPGEMALLQQYGNSFPLLDLGGRYVQVGASYDIELLHGLEWEQIAGALADPKSNLARAIDGSANVITAALCTLTNGQPTQVCNGL